MKLLNGYLLTKEVQEKESTFIMNAAKAYRELQVTHVKEGTEVEVGDTVYVLKKAGTEMEIDGTKFTTIHERDIILIK